VTNVMHCILGTMMVLVVCVCVCVCVCHAGADNLPQTYQQFLDINFK